MRANTSAIVLAAVMLSACGREPMAMREGSTRVEAASVKEGTGAVSPGDVARDLALLRRVTAPYQQFDRGTASGLWSTKITDCMTDPKLGGMGFHYGKTSLIDGRVAVDEPELLLYEPQSNGRMRLVAVEYIMPLQLSATPPRLFGRDFSVNAAFGIWALHAWVWKDNPSGMFADWNPRVTCPAGTPMSNMTH